MDHSPFRFTNEEEKRDLFLKARSLARTDPNEFWRLEAKDLFWQEHFHSVHDGKFAFGEWFLGGMLNASFNCLDRHVLAGKGDKKAIIFEDEKGNTSSLSYSELLSLTLDIATFLHNKGVKAGDRVAIYLPMIPHAVASMLACARIGAIHTVVFGGFSKEALSDRIHDAGAKAVITAEETTRKGQKLPLKKVVLEALQDERTNTVSTVLCFGLQGSLDKRVTAFTKPSSLPEEIKKPKAFDAQHPLFILYTSGTTGKPKGIFHATGGYLTQVSSTTKWAFSLNDDDIYWCTADVGWITGHSYITYGPLLHGKTIFIYDGALTFPDASRIYQIIDRHKITVLYTAPTALRIFMRAGNEIRKPFSLKTLRLLGSVGEPINPEVWQWYRRVFGDERLSIVDTFWQTETGAMMITPLPSVSRQKPGCATEPFLGISAKVVGEDGHECGKNTKGFLIFDRPWPSLARGIWDDQQRFLDTYFNKLPQAYFTGDGAIVDDDGDITIIGRIDDVVNVSGHRLGTAEIESALVAHDSVAEAAAVGVPDEITGQKLVAFVVLMPNNQASKELEDILKEHVKTCIGSFARPKEIHFYDTLPKTRSGKIMRRLLRELAEGKKITSDVSTLDPVS